jgi:hypothetical protein
MSVLPKSLVHAIAEQIEYARSLWKSGVK